MCRTDTVCQPNTLLNTHHWITPGLSPYDKYHANHRLPFTYVHLDKQSLCFCFTQCFTTVHIPPVHVQKRGLSYLEWCYTQTIQMLFTQGIKCYKCFSDPNKSKPKLTAAPGRIQHQEVYVHDSAHWSSYFSPALNHFQCSQDPPKSFLQTHMSHTRTPR